MMTEAQKEKHRRECKERVFLRTTQDIRFKIGESIENNKTNKDKLLSIQNSKRFKAYATKPIKRKIEEYIKGVKDD